MDQELLSCTPTPLDANKFNLNAQLPYDLTINQLRLALEDFFEFLGFVNLQLNGKELDRLESFMMQANFSSMVGEFMSTTIPKYSATITKNLYHNGHPDLLPTDFYLNNSILRGEEGIEIKSSRTNSWQGHNPESCWILLFNYDANKPGDLVPRPFKFKKILLAKLEESDWNFSGRSATSRRTITATINASGREKLHQNWIYIDND